MVPSMRNWHRSGCEWLCLIALAGLLAFPSARAETAEAALVRLAGKIPFVNYGDLFYQRSPHALPDDPRIATAAAGLNEVLGVAGDLNEFSRLSEHSDPRVRMLALIRLYGMEQPEAFIAIQRRMNDAAETFPYQSVPCGRPFGEKPAVVTESRTIGYWATWMMEQVGFQKNGQEDFDSWKARRIGNPDWIAWYDFLYRRASGATQPLPDAYVPRVAALKKRMEAATPAVRAWFWFGLADDALMVPRYDTAMATQQELIAAGKAIGPEALLAFLRDGSRAGLREPKVDDPQRGRRFILSHGGDLFRAEDAAALAEMGHFVTAADANPAMASRLIREGLTGTNESPNHWDQARAVAALMDLRGDEETGFVVKWFYDAPVKVSQSSDRGVFLTELKRRGPKQWRKTLREIVAHPGFEKLEGLEVAYVAMLVNQLSGEKVVPDNMMTSGGDHETRGLLRKYFGLPGAQHLRLEPVANPAEKPLWSVELGARPHRMILSPDGKTIALGMLSGGVRLFDAATGRDLGTLEMKGWQPTLGFRKSDGHLLVVDSAVLTEWDVPQRQIVSQAKAPNGWSECAIHPSGGILASRNAGGDDCGIAMYNLPGGNQRWLFPVSIRGGGVIQFSNDAQRLVASDAFTHDLYLFETGSAKPIAKLSGHSDVPSHACFSPDGRWLATVGGGKILLWDGRTGELRKQFLSRYGSALCFTADSQAFVVASDSSQMTRFDPATGKALAGYEIQAGYALMVLAGADGGHLFMAIEGSAGVRRLLNKEDGAQPDPTRLECWAR